MMSGQFRCRQCGRQVKRIQGIVRHKCIPQLEKTQSRTRLQRNNHEVSLDTSSIISLPLPYHNLGSSCNIGVEGEDEDENEDDFNGLLVADWGEEAEDDDRPLDTVSQLSKAMPLGNIHNSTSSSVRLVYIDPDEMGMFPGAPVDKEDWEAQDISREIGEWPGCQELLRKDNIYWPFRDEKEFSRASYFLKYGLSKGAIDNFPDGTQSFNEFSTTINKIPFGIKTAEGRNEWCTETVSLPALNPGNPNDKFTVRFRRIKPVLEFLLGHEPWDEDLSWAPVRKYCDDREQRIYDEMHTGTWWWDQQLKLEPGGTLVPIMLASDKTLMTQHSGEKRCWPVYLTVGNLSRAARRRQLDPGMLLIAFLPEYKKDTKGLDSSKLIGTVRQRRRQLYHSSMKVVLQGLKELEGGWLVRCADDNVRHCFPVLGPFICDYEEAVLVTGIKNGQQCALCQATKSDFNKITEEWPARTHRQTRSQLSKQNERGIPESDNSYIHQHESFAWNLRGANIHESISVDILHQLKKGVFQRLLEQLQAVIKKRVVGGSQFCAGKRKQNETPGLMQLDARFEKMPVYQGLKRFYRFSHHGQTTGEDSQAIARQIIPAITPLLLVISPDAILFTRAIVDFVLLAQYKSHSDETLKKLSHAIDRIWHMKGSLHEGMARKEQIDELWNQPKFHSLSHYIPSIRKYGAADGIDTAQFEVGHKLFLKKYFGRTNKSKNFEEQIASHNTRAGKMSAFESMLLAHRTTTNVVNIENKAKVTTVSGVAMTTDLIGCRPIPQKICKMLNLSIDQTTTAAEAQTGTFLYGFLAALAEFVKDCREMMMQGQRKHRLPRERGDQNTMWIRNYPVQLFPSIRCWKRSANTEELETEFLRCVEDWRGEGKRHDFCWVQEFPPGETSEPWDGRCCGQIQAIVHVLDIGYPEEDLEDGFPSYYGVLVDVNPWVAKGNEKGQPHKVHGMVELHAPQVPTVTNPRSLKQRRFYTLDTVLRSAHVIPARTEGERRPSDIFYINNYIDWDQYNTLFRSRWMEEGRKQGRAMRSRNEAVEKKRRNEMKVLVKDISSDSSSRSHLKRKTERARTAQDSIRCSGRVSGPAMM